MSDSANAPFINYDIRLSHWLPIRTTCPVNGRPDFVYVTLHCEGFIELYAARKLIRSVIKRKRRAFMEDLARRIHCAFNPPLLHDADRGVYGVTVSLMFGRHSVYFGEKK